jgi:hypothetical protein
MQKIKINKTTRNLKKSDSKHPDAERFILTSMHTWLMGRKRNRSDLHVVIIDVEALGHCGTNTCIPTKHKSSTVCSQYVTAPLRISILCESLVSQVLLKGPSRWKSLGPVLTGYDATAGRLRSTLPTVPISHYAISISLWPLRITRLAKDLLKTPKLRKLSPPGYRSLTPISSTLG